MSQANSRHVQLTYYKSSGKYYTSGSYTTEHKDDFRVYEEVRQMRDEGQLPGLREGATEFIIEIGGTKEDLIVPALILLD